MRTNRRLPPGAGWSGLLIGSALVLMSCAPIQPSSMSDQPNAPATQTPIADEQRFPTILDARLSRNPDGAYDVAVTISSPYDTPERYADGWRVLTPDGRILGEHILLHDHANEQPFTRTQRGLTIPPGIEEVNVEGRDLVYGYGGQTVTVAVPR
jgi:hypothetical protein